ncbi:MAG TPA: hypothetical protein VI248_22870 [Kineosporiaceae bacterium]
MSAPDGCRPDRLVRPLRYDPADVTDRTIDQPWYRTKTEPSFEDMILKLRKTIIAARFTGVTPGQPDPDLLLRGYALACNAAAA